MHTMDNNNSQCNEETEMICMEARSSDDDNDND